MKGQGVRGVVTTSLEVVGLAVVCLAVFLAAPAWAGVLAVGLALLVIGAAEGRKP